MQDEIEVVVEKTSTRRIELTTDDIEALLTEVLKLSKNAEFSWSIGQWASLSVVDKRKEIL